MGISGRTTAQGVVTRLRAATRLSVTPVARTATASLLAVLGATTLGMALRAPAPGVDTGVLAVVTSTPPPPTPSAPPSFAPPVVLEPSRVLAASFVGPRGTGSWDVPERAYRAYAFAAAVVRLADPGCGLTWALPAAIGEVASDHGREGSATLGDDGVSRPLLRGEAVGRDTDSGTVDGDRRHDRAVGPMRLLPAAWSQTGVDADGDGIRSADDLDDAALGVAVHLCSAAGDLTTKAGRLAALRRFDPSPGWAAHVLMVAKAYHSGAAEVIWPPLPAWQVRAARPSATLRNPALVSASPEPTPTPLAHPSPPVTPPPPPSPSSPPSDEPTVPAPTADPSTSPTPSPEPDEPSPSDDPAPPPPSCSPEPTPAPGETPDPTPDPAPTPSADPTADLPETGTTPPSPTGPTTEPTDLPTPTDPPTPDPPTPDPPTPDPPAPDPPAPGCSV